MHKNKKNTSKSLRKAKKLNLAKETGLPVSIISI